MGPPSYIGNTKKSIRKQVRRLLVQETISKIPFIGKTCLSNLSHCCFRENHIEWKEANVFVNTFKKFTKLQHATISHITDFEIKRLAPHLLKLQSLTLKTSITNNGLNFLSTLIHLQILEISESNRITDAGLRALRPLTSLHSLILNGGPGVTLNRGENMTITGIAQLKHLPLKNLELREFFEININEGGTPASFIPYSIKPLAGFKGLQNLKFVECFVDNFEEVLHMDTLQTLTMISCSTLTMRSRDTSHDETFSSLEKLMEEQRIQIISKDYKKSRTKSLIKESTIFQLKIDQINNVICLYLTDDEQQAHYFS